VKIGINASFLNEKPTGVGVFTREVSSRLCALHPETVILTSVPIAGVGDDRIRKTPFSVRGGMKFSSNLMRMIYDNALLPFAIRRYGIDVLFCPILEFPLIPTSRLVVTVHDLHPIYFPEQFGMAARHFRFSLKLLPRIADRVIVPSHFVKEEILKVCAVESRRIDVLHGGYDSHVFKPLSTGMEKDSLERHGIRGPYILFVGSLFPYKNVTTLIKAFLEIKNRIPHSLVIIGKRELSRDPLPEDERIHCIGYIEREGLATFYSSADLLVHPSFFEGFGITILEAMACGAPVISSRGGSLPEVVGDAGILFDPHDGASLSRLILDVLGNRRLRNELVEKGFEQVKGFSWDKTAAGVLRTCEQAVS